MKKLTILLAISQILSIISTTEKIPNLDKDAFKKMSENEKYFLISRLISEYNNIIQYYNDNNIENENILTEKNKELEKYKNILKRNNILCVDVGVGFGFQFQQSINIQLSYTRLFFQLFSFNTSVSYNHNIQSFINSQLIISIGLGYIF